MELQDYIQFFIDNRDLARLLSCQNVVFAFGYLGDKWIAGYKEEDANDRDPWIMELCESSTTIEDAIAWSYAKCKPIFAELRKIVSGLKRPTSFTPEGKYRYVTCWYDGIRVKRVDYIDPGDIGISSKFVDRTTGHTMRIYIGDPSLFEVAA